MSDDEFVQAFLSGSLPNAQFHHRDHLRLTWLLVRRLGPAAGSDAVASGIQRFATHHGHAAKYHETMTRFWARLVAHLTAARPDLTEFDAFLAAFPHLLDITLPYRHWRPETMADPAARAHWVEPDVLALP